VLWKKINFVPGVMKNVYLKILDLANSGTGLALATVINSVGSTPQKPGSSALFDRTGLIYGTVGGGVVEGTVEDLALKSLLTKESSSINISLNKDISSREEAICGGEISILIDANPNNYIPVFEEIKKTLKKREPGVLITMITGYSLKQVLINRYWMTEKVVPSLSAEFLEKIGPEVKSILSSGNHDDFRRLEIGIPGEEPSSVFCLEPLFPSPHLIIAGAGHIGKALSHLGKMLDFEVTVIDDRSEYANAGNLPDADHIIVKDIGLAVSEINKGSDTFIVIVTRGHNDDAKALLPCIGSGAAYTGMIGSKGKVAKIHAEFIQKGWATEEQWNTIYSPIGLDIRSKTVEEIAVSIAAQLVMVKNSGR
jgi:xanthine dehydrogenase accessory factor